MNGRRLRRLWSVKLPRSAWRCSFPRQVQELRVISAEEVAAKAGGGEHLSSKEVSSLPLNARDFSKLLLLAAGTMTDANGAANFTQQFAVNGQRGSATVFAMDGFDTTDPEMGGATFSNFNVDAIQEVQSDSGVMQAEIGHGAAGYTNVVTKSGVNQIHGSMFEFLRNASLDARNYFDYRDPTGKQRIPPFVRNEFGFTNGGPVVLPGMYDGRNRTYYFGEYQGFRQVLGTTQVIPVPTADERLGNDTTAYPRRTIRCSFRLTRESCRCSTGIRCRTSRRDLWVGGRTPHRRRWSRGRTNFLSASITRFRTRLRW